MKYPWKCEFSQHSSQQFFYPLSLSKIGCSYHYEWAKFILSFYLEFGASEISV